MLEACEGQEVREISESRFWRERTEGPGPYSIPLIAEFPQQGYYKSRLVKRGPLVPVRIWSCQLVDIETGDLMADEEFMATAGGKSQDPYQIWSYCCDKPISEADYWHMVRDAAWCREHAPDDPAANPRQPVNMLTAPIPT